MNDDELGDSVLAAPLPKTFVLDFAPNKFGVAALLDDGEPNIFGVDSGFEGACDPDPNRLFDVGNLF